MRLVAIMKARYFQVYPPNFKSNMMRYKGQKLVEPHLLADGLMDRNKKLIIGKLLTLLAQITEGLGFGNISQLPKRGAGVMLATN